MLELWSPAMRHGLWRQLWLALAEAEKNSAFRFRRAIAQMREHSTTSISTRSRRTSGGFVA
jgi:adenylosuccinate lyase